ncbi:secreted/periplasmic Zn-dependent insulinase-like peptidase [Encephalitozoon romaleae SJ-2008]|uniref:Secreted/periplasmic Zn-dependent insulinase-like peptidase n=1 Tax=Encephalitozoon romaleae (strain SJ-2008) TaxID=1178016 RepID=I6ZU41_ENCRO|nr:secreted/periplasmic Zn-dependent insulinase-like peptidase [Encephalitozoon romaleae SJ-2008]AFN83161.1 secreted/periplasmic Zn-dependent insulinase-like peptidase [Encephalitozoon romaleae SJ-2008]
MTKNIRKSLADTMEYEHVEMPNGIHALVISDPSLDKCSCAVSVKVGAFDNPESAQGLAHFLEHMLFMGTEKYPDEEGFSKFLARNNGGYNATTYGEVTIYYFDVAPKAFEEGVDRLADFFKAPLLKKNSVEREVSAVHSEFCNGLNVDDWRIWRMMARCCKKELPISKFSTGNYDTLRREGIWEEMKDFWRKKYSCDKMCVVIYGNKSPSELKKLLKKFEGVPKGLEEKECSGKNMGSELEEGWSVFDTEYTNRWIRVEPIADTKSIVVTITVESGYKVFRNNPYECITEMILRDDPRGFACKVKDKGLALDVECENANYTDYSLIIITVHLSVVGSKRPKDVVLELVKYIQGMNITESEYEELKKRSRYLFKYEENDEPMYQTQKIAKRMQFYPIENVLDKDYCFERFDENEMKRIIKRMGSFSEWLVFHVAKDAGVFDMCEEIYGVRFGLGDKILEAKDIKGEPLEKVDSVEWKEGEMASSENGSDIISKEFPGGKINYLFNDTYKVPKVFIGYLIRTENISKESRVDMMFLAENAKSQFFKKHGGYLYGTGVDVSVRIEHYGIEIRIECFNHMSVEVSQKFFDILFGDPDQSRKDLIKEKIRNELEIMRNSSPYRRCDEGMRWMKVPDHMMAEEMMEKLHSVDTRCKMSRKFFLEMFAIGNIEYSDAEKIFNHVLSKQVEVYNYKRKGLLDGRYKCDVKTSDKVNNACTVNYYCGKYGNHVDAAMTHLVHQSCMAMFFDDLRTKEELGYVVASRVMHLDDEQYIVFLVQSEKDVDFLEKRIRKFVEDLDGYYKEMSEEQFEEFKSGVISFFKEKKKNFEIYSTDMWGKYLRGVVDLKYEDKAVDAVSKISKKDLSIGKVFGPAYVSRVFAH